MDCNFWSCYVHEDERLLIGGLKHFPFETIRNIAQSENYDQYIKILNILHTMVNAVGLDGIQPRAEDILCLKRMIDVEIGACSSFTSSVPKYVQTLFHHFLMKKVEIIINLIFWQAHYLGYIKHLDGKVYGYKKFAKLFGYNKFGPKIDFGLFIKLFPNLVTFTIADFQISRVNPSIELSQEFAARMVGYIEYLNKSSKSLSLSRFQIIQPSSPIIEFIESNKYVFEQKGWKLKKDVWVHGSTFSNLGPQPMLLIEKMSN